jgi:hypothetical protein
MSISYTYTVSSTITAAVTAVSISASTASYDISADNQPTTDIEVSVYVVPLVPLAEERVFVSENAIYDIGLNKDDDVTVSEEAVKELDAVYTDTVTVTESTFKVFTNPVDFDPSDDDVDPTPVFMADTQALSLERPDVADSVVVTETAELAPEKVLSDTLPTPTDAIDDFDIGLNKADAVTASEAIDKFDVTTKFTDNVVMSDTPEKNFTLSDRTDEVEMLGSNIKAFNSSVDFDRSDDDVDPDPITPSDQINTLGVGLNKTDSVSATETDAKDFEFGGFYDSATAGDSPEIDVTKPVSDAVTAVEGAKFESQLAKTDTVTAADAINKFDARPVKADDVTPADTLNKLDVVLTKTDSVNITDVSVKNFTENVDFDRNDADADPDPVTMTEVIGLNTTRPLTDAVSPSDVNIFNFTKVSTDSITAAENINLTLILGESSYMYPSRVDMSDGSNKFVQDWFRFSKLDYTAQLNGGDSLLNSAVIWGDSAEDLARAPFTGVIGSDGFIGQVVVNSDTITYPDTSNAGLVVNFLYTEVSDTTLGGYYFNQTPISAGSIEGGDRTIL